jgi:hypothetical protein
MIYNNYEKTLDDFSQCSDDELFKAIRQHDITLFQYQSAVPLTLDDITDLFLSSKSPSKLHVMEVVTNRSGRYRNGMFSICETSYVNNNGEISFWGYCNRRE